MEDSKIGLQIILCVETNTKAKTDYLYIKTALNHFYHIDNRNGIKLSPVFVLNVPNTLMAVLSSLNDFSALLFVLPQMRHNTNNSAEREMRLPGVKRAVVGSFDTLRGADAFAKAWAYISSAKKKFQSAYGAVPAALQGGAVDFLFSEDEIMELGEDVQNMDKVNQ